MNIDLTGLAEIVQSAAGEPLIVPLGAISCDSNQPRQHIDESALQELAESIRSIGVVQPISVRPDPAAAGRYIINYGERRYRAAVIAGLSAIPTFVHKTPNSYTQVAENLHRADLSPMEMALFIKTRIEGGEKKSEIAAKLGYKRSYVTEHLALLESPVCVEKAYRNGVTSARTLYDLRRLHDEFPQQVDAWCASGVELTREAIVALGQRIRHDEQLGGLPQTAHSNTGPLVASALPSDTPAFEHPIALETETVSVKDGTATTHGSAADRDVAPSPAPRNPPQQTRSRGSPSAGQPSSRLRIKVNYSGRNATIQDDSIVRICYDDGGMAEVRLADTVIVAAVAAR
jgi:ParB family chromosome partitioning protein